MTTNDQPMDHAPPEDTADDDRATSELEKNVKEKSTWVRLFFMLVLLFLYGVSRLVVGVVIAIQFCYALFTGETRSHLRAFGHSLAVYSLQVIDYLTFNTDEKPFPFDLDWPTESRTD
ncbi:MAG: DUF4389 domain-containing protein [Woeseiaceae bacterium]|nr:DUF4389 domain-containing protein [Woeseiaceae bacterium]